MTPPNGKTMHQMRLIYYRRQGGLCWLCSEPIDLFQPVHTYGAPSWEHIIPRCIGGSNTWVNVVMTHNECNKARRDRFIWRLERPAPGQSLKRGPSIQSQQRYFQHQIVNRLRPLFERARMTEIR
jgi:hypothetical protein